MERIEFEKIEAASFALVDIETGSPVGSANDPAEVYSILDESRTDDVEVLDRLLVVALDKAGRRLGSWKASDLYLAA